MRVLTLSTYDSRSGGAAEAARRLHHGLAAAGHTCRMAVQKRFTSDDGVVQAGGPPAMLLSPLRYHLDAVPLRFGYPHRRPRLWSPAWLGGSPVLGESRRWQPDVVHLHWVCHGYLSPADVAHVRAPCVWTLHDMWPFTGGCHFAGDCRRYENACGACPQLGSDVDRDLSRCRWDAKRRAWDRANFVVVTPSRWLADCARKSALLASRRIEVIPNAIDAGVFRLQAVDYWRCRFGLPADKTRLLCPVLGAGSDPNKGLDLLMDALRLLDGEVRRSCVLVLCDPSPGAVPDDPPMSTHVVDRVADSTAMAGLYSACDAVVVPSRLENLSCAIMEAMACGRPVAAFAAGGNRDLVEHGKTGYLARAYDVTDLASGLGTLLGSERKRQQYGDAARAKVCERFDVQQIVARHVALYEDVLSTAAARGSAP